MTPQRCMMVSALAAAAVALAFVTLVRLPLPFPGFGIALGAVLAGLGTLTIAAWLPARLLWTDQERLVHAFCAQHGVSPLSAATSLKAMTEAHDRAETLRQASAGFREDIRDQVALGADRLDAAAREIFYDPSRLRSLQPILARAPLIVDAVLAHRALRSRSEDPAGPVAQSRADISRALAALKAAFDESDLRVAVGLQQDVEAASDVAEMLLAPRRPIDPKG